MTEQSEAKTSEGDLLRVDVANLKKRLNRRNAQLKANRKELRKEKKKLERTDERLFTSTFNKMVRKAHEVGLDHKLLLIEGMEDPVGQEDAPDESNRLFGS